MEFIKHRENFKGRERERNIIGCSEILINLRSQTHLAMNHIWVLT